MKRPLALIGITYLSVLAVVFYLDSAALLIVIFLASLLTAAVLLLLRISLYVKKTAVIICITAMLACASSCCYSLFYCNITVEKYSGRELNVKALSCEEVGKSYGSYVYQLETDEINGEEVSVKILLVSYKELKIKPYDKVECKITPYENDSGYYKSRGIFLSAYTDGDFTYTVSENTSKPLYYYAISVRQAMKTAINTLLPSDLSSLCNAVMLGDKSSLSQSVRCDFSDTGVSFLIVVSGMHLAVVSGFVLFLVKKITKNRLAQSFSVFIAVVIFMTITGFTPSVVRSGIMIIIAFCGKIVFRRGDSLNSLGAAALCLTLFNPYAVGDVGMLLSFAATMGIVLWSGSICSAIMAKFKNVKRFRRFLYSAVELFSVSLSASLWVIPFSILFFGRLSPYCVIVSMLVSPFINILINCALLASVFFYCGIFSFLAYPFALVAGLAGRYILAVVGLFAQIPYCSVNADKPYFYVWLFVSIALAILGVFIKNKGTYIKFSSVFSLCVLMLGYVIYAVISVNTTTLTVCSSGNGITASVSRGRNLSVISCGGAKSLVSQVTDSVQRIATHIDYMIIPSQNNFYDAYFMSFQNEFDAANILLYDSEGESQTMYDGVNVFGDDMRFALELNENTTDRIINVNGHTYQYIVSGRKTALVMPYNGDALELPENYRSADYLLTNSLPKNSGLLSVDTVIFSADENTCDNYKDRLYRLSQNIIFTTESNCEIVIG